MPADNGTQDAGTGQQQQQAQQPPQTYEAWLERQDETAKGLISSHTSGLAKSLKDERDARKALEKQIGDLGKLNGDNEQLKKQLSDIGAQLKAATRRERFGDDAAQHRPTNAKLVFAAAVADGLVDDDGKADWSELKKRYPELFPKTPAGNAGNGSGAPPQATTDMNTFIRRSAGYQ